MPFEVVGAVFVVVAFRQYDQMSETSAQPALNGFSGLLRGIDTVQPDEVWAAIRGKVRVAPAQAMLLADEDIALPPAAALVRIVAISDTHNNHGSVTVPPCDILIHGGDFTDSGSPEDIERFAAWLEAQTQATHKVVIAGNHELSLDADSYDENWRRFGHREKHDTAKLVARLRSVCHYLEHEPLELMGLRIFGSPFQPEFYGWGFNLPRGPQCRDKWESMRCPGGVAGQRNIDILVTHGPPLGHGDECSGKNRAGCAELLDFIEHAEPLLHVFGHIHGGYGATTNGRTLMLNASTMNSRYDAGSPNPPMVVDVPTSEHRAPFVASLSELATS
jgi:predicted phosphodiesterase